MTFTVHCDSLKFLVVYASAKLICSSLIYST